MTSATWLKGKSLQLSMIGRRRKPACVNGGDADTQGEEMTSALSSVLMQLLEHSVLS